MTRTQQLILIADVDDCSSSALRAVGSASGGLTGGHGEAGPPSE